MQGAIFSVDTSSGAEGIREIFTLCSQEPTCTYEDPLYDLEPKSRVVVALVDGQRVPLEVAHEERAIHFPESENLQKGARVALRLRHLSIGDIPAMLKLPFGVDSPGGVQVYIPTEFAKKLERSVLPVSAG